MSAAQDRLLELSRLLAQKSPGGAYLVDDRSASATLSLLALVTLRGRPSLALPRFLLERLGGFVEEAKIEPGPGEGVELERYLLRALPPALRLEVEHFLREARSADPAEARSLAGLLGINANVLKSSGPRPAGTTPAGPLARFQLTPAKG